jgi:hypothetical protein
VAAKLHQALQPSLNELFFAHNVVLVEGLEDTAVITSWMVLTGRWKEFREKGLHIVPVGGKSYLLHPLAIAQELGIPVFTVFDADGHDARHQDLHKADNERLLGLLGGPTEPFPKETEWGTRHVMWPDEITEVVRREVPADKLTAFGDEANKRHGDPGGLQKNSLQIGTKLQLLFEDGIRPPSLDKLCDAILAAAEAPRRIVSQSDKAGSKPVVT